MRGQPDYMVLRTETARTIQSEINSGVYDVGFSRIDSGGRLIWFDDFRAGLHRYNLFIDGAGLLPLLDVSEYHMFGFSPTAKFQPVAQDGQSGLDAYFVMPVSGKIGLEFGFYKSLNGGQLDVTFVFCTSTGSNRTFSVTLDEQTSKIYITANGSLQLIYSPSISAEMENRHKAIKLIVDPSTGLYDSLLVGTGFVDLSSYLAPLSFTSDAGTVFMEFVVSGISGTYKEPIWIDYIAISADEP